MIVVDTGPLVAAVLSNDADHRECVDLFAAAHLNREQLVVPSFVIPEVCYLIQREVVRRWKPISWNRSLRATSRSPSATPSWIGSRI
ncbi:PIN domain-containing protein [Kribbella sp. NPDC051936]|uniref:PIN domain-containing protein n=1 Tax=Kribbella sp. NPDC051936 TaxID=3154946 RepID=UPI00341C286B